MNDFEVLKTSLQAIFLSQLPDMTINFEDGNDGMQVRFTNGWKSLEVMQVGSKITVVAYQAIWITEEGKSDIIERQTAATFDIGTPTGHVKAIGPDAMLLLFPFIIWLKA